MLYTSGTRLPISPHARLRRTISRHDFAARFHSTISRLIHILSRPTAPRHHYLRSSLSSTDPVPALSPHPITRIQIVNKTKKMAKAGATLDKKPTIIVAVLAGVVGVMFILFGILEVRPVPLFIPHVHRCRASEDTPPTQSTAPYTSQSSTHSRLLFFSTKKRPSLVSSSPPLLISQVVVPVLGHRSCAVPRQYRHLPRRFLQVAEDGRKGKQDGGGSGKTHSQHRVLVDPLRARHSRVYGDFPDD